MTVDEIKQSVSMREVTEQYGFHPNRAGFISCPFHQKDHTPSMKIYKRDYYCHACGCSGDIFSFVMGMENCSFKDAFKSLGGTYEKKSDYSHKVFNYRIEKRKETEKVKADARKSERIQLLKEIKMESMLKNLSPPLSDIWCESVNRLEYLFYKLEAITTEKR